MNGFAYLCGLLEYSRMVDKNKERLNERLQKVCDRGFIPPTCECKIEIGEDISWETQLDVGGSDWCAATGAGKPISEAE